MPRDWSKKRVMGSKMEGGGDWRKGKLRVCLYKGNGTTDVTATGVAKGRRKYGKKQSLLTNG